MMTYNTRMEMSDALRNAITAFLTIEYGEGSTAGWFYDELGYDVRVQYMSDEQLEALNWLEPVA